MSTRILDKLVPQGINNVSYYSAIDIPDYLRFFVEIDGPMTAGQFKEKLIAKLQEPTCGIELIPEYTRNIVNGLYPNDDEVVFEEVTRTSKVYFGVVTR